MTLAQTDQVLDREDVSSPPRAMVDQIIPGQIGLEKSKVSDTAVTVKFNKFENGRKYRLLNFAYQVPYGVFFKTTIL